MDPEASLITESSVYHNPDMAPTGWLGKGHGEPLCFWSQEVILSLHKSPLQHKCHQGYSGSGAVWGSRLALCEGVLRLRVLTLRSQHWGSRTGTVARGSGVAGAALKGRVEVVNGFL